MKFTEEQKALVIEHRILIAQFADNQEKLARIAEIEHILNMTTEQLAELAINDYLKQY